MNNLTDIFQDVASAMLKPRIDINKPHREALRSVQMPNQLTSIIGLMRAELQLEADNLIVTKYLLSLYDMLPEDQREMRPDKRLYPDICFFNHYPVGISLSYSPNTGPADCCNSVHGELGLDAVDIFNPSASAPPPAAEPKRHRPPPPTYSTPPNLPLILHLASQTSPLEITSSTTGAQFVAYLGEPQRKGGGQSWMGIWIEWHGLKVLDPRVPGVELEMGLLVELRDPKGDEWLSDEQMLKGAGGIWDRSGAWKWANLKVFTMFK